MYRVLPRFALLQRRAFNAHANPYKAKRPWPPDFSKLSEKHKFRLEKRYRRRAKLKWARPEWTKSVKLVQLGSAISIMVYGIFFMEWNTEGKDPPFKAARDWYKNIADTIWTHSSTEARKSVTSSSNANTNQASKP